ncbi:GntR family transcriptional regulator [Streptomyces sp. NBC_00988]|uniref:GntR family transcriptional regulator n=1 Tax=Streptomyces sp. NBC_00988 TaxID=2903704 RepID=UPI0038701474|nr:GntR family transcriptional regulator [Streptomyces sp. NBC_00988]
MFGVPPIQQQASLGDHVVRELRAMIINGSLPPGTHLVESRLSEEFGVSRGPVRDALRQLEAEGLVESRGRGLSVIGLHDEDIDELYSLRGSLESLALRRSCARLSGTQWDVLNEHLDAMREAADRRDAAGFAVADLEFHSRFYELSGHRRLRSVWQHYLPTFTVLLQVTTAYDDDLHPSAESHLLLLNLVRSGQVEEAVTELSGHLLGASQRLRAARARVAGSAGSAAQGVRGDR